MKEILRKNESVKRWLNSKSSNTKRSYLTGLAEFCEFHDIQNPEEIVEEVLTKLDSKELFSDSPNKKIDEWAESLYEGNSDPTVRQRTRAVLSYINYYLKKNEGKKISYTWKDRDESITQSRILKPREARKLIDNLKNLRDKTIVSLAYQSGLGIGDIVNLKKKYLEFVDDNRIQITKKRKKSKQKHYTFAGKYTREYLEKWLKKRKEIGKYEPDSHVFVYTSSGKTIDGDARINHRIRETCLRIDLLTKEEIEENNGISPITMHSLRKSFSARLKAEGVFEHEDVEFMMGHSLDYRGTYEVYSERIEEMREKYKKSSALALYQKGVNKEELKEYKQKVDELEKKVKEKDRKLERLLKSIEKINQPSIPEKYLGEPKEEGGRPIKDEYFKDIDEEEAEISDSIMDAQVEAEEVEGSNEKEETKVKENKELFEVIKNLQKRVNQLEEQ
ncbi:hypothetical protein C9439_02955 [archaeon SCG-AAA382B04]|nr:hypothetical protein C9439_02955 [archaeon SCG-AAA382B04]